MQLNNKTRDEGSHTEVVNNEASELKQYFINNEKYQLLRAYQQCIFEETDVTYRANLVESSQAL